MKRKIALLSLVVVLAGCLTACGAGDYARRTDDTNTMYVGVVQASFPTAFMPWLSREGIAPTIASTVYNTLFSYDDETGNFDGIIGKDWYYVDADGEPILTDEGRIDYERLEAEFANRNHLAVKVILHDNVTWSDGTPLTASDVFYTYDLATNNYLSNHAGALAWTADLRHGYDQNTGARTRLGLFYYGNRHEHTYDIPEEDKDTVLYMHVNTVLGAVTSLFTTILIIPRHIWEPVVCRENQLNARDPSGELLDCYCNPIGSGPYTLDTERSGSSMIVLNRREDYHLTDDDGGPLYKVDTIKFMLYQELNVAIYALMKGHIDVLHSSISSNYIRLFDDREDIFVSNAEGVYVQTLVLNVNPIESERNPIRDLLGDVDFRRAIALAIDPDELIEQVANGAAYRTSAGLMRERMEDFYNPDANILAGDQEEKLEEANEILDGIVPEKDAQGYRLLDGQRISYDILGHPHEQELISFLQIQMQKIGIEVNYAAKGSQPENTFLYTSRFDMTIHGVIFSLANVDIMYNAHFVQLGRTSNYGRLQDDALRTGIREMRNTLNLHRKYELIIELQPVIAEQYYKIPLYTSNVISIARTDRYTGWQVVPGSTAYNSDSLQNVQRVGED